MFKLIVTRELHFSSEVWTHTSDLAKGFIEELLVRDPKERSTIPELLKHAWLQKYVEIDARTEYITLKEMENPECQSML